MATPSRTSQRVRFGEFELDLSTRELWANGSKQTLAPQPFQVLQLLIEHRGVLVTREMLIARLWPSDIFVDYEQGLKKAVARLRENLSDSADKPRFVENLPRQGYRFIAELEFDTAEQTPVSKSFVLYPHLVEGEESSHAKKRKPFPVSLVIASLLLVIACGGGILFWRSRAPRRELSLVEPKLIQLTANSIDNPVVSSAISPDGKYLAFTDTLNKIRIRLLATGETQTIAGPESLLGGSVEWAIASWFPDSTRFIVNARSPQSYAPFPTRFQLFIPSRGDSAEAASKSSVWIVSVLGKTAQKLRDDADAFSVSPDGALIAFGTNAAQLGDREIWLMNSKGLQARKLYEAPANTAVGGLNWLRDGLHVVYFQLTGSGGELVSRDLRGGPAIPLVQYSGWWSVTDFVLLADGRMIYAREGNLWELPIDVSSGKSVAMPRKLTNWSGFWLGEMSTAGDGKQLAFQRWAWQTTVSVADIEAHGTHVSPPRHLTLSEHMNAAETWTPDSAALIFRSRRDGRTHLFKQALDSDTEQPLVMGAEEVGGAAISPDGSWLFYLDCGREENCDLPTTPVMAVPIGGGTPHQVLTSNTYGRPRCAVAPSNLCVIAEQSEDGKPLIFTAFDALNGRGAEIARFETVPAAEYHWGLSADGTRIGILKFWDDRMHIVPLNGQAPQEVIVKDGIRAAGVFWAADGKGWFTQSKNQGSLVLLYVDLQGNIHSLWELKGGAALYGLPSPDGRHLAIVATARNNNVWLMEKF